MKQKSNNQNQLTLKGIVKTEPHRLCEDDTLYEFDLGILRDSGYEDVIKVVYNSKTIEPLESVSLIEVGESVAIWGKVAVFNTYDEETGKRHAHLRAFADTFTRGLVLPEYFNEVKFDGILAQDVNRRITPKGRTIADFVVSNYCDGHYNFIVCVAWGRKADLLKFVCKGERISVRGRFQSREYQKDIGDNTIEIRTAYEISVGSFSITISEA